MLRGIINDLRKCLVVRDVILENINIFHMFSFISLEYGT